VDPFQRESLPTNLSAVKWAFEINKHYHEPGLKLGQLSSIEWQQARYERPANASALNFKATQILNGPQLYSLSRRIL
jgi:hypothetical protein